MKWIVAAALAGWAAIVALAYSLADDRIDLCGDRWSNKACYIKATAERDFVLIAGLSVALAFVLFVAVLWVRNQKRAGSESFMAWRPTRRVHTLQAR